MIVEKREGERVGRWAYSSYLTYAPDVWSSSSFFMFFFLIYMPCGRPSEGKRDRTGTPHIQNAKHVLMLLLLLFFFAAVSPLPRRAPSQQDTHPEISEMASLILFHFLAIHLLILAFCCRASNKLFAFFCALCLFMVRRSPVSWFIDIEVLPPRRRRQRWR